MSDLDPLRFYHRPISIHIIEVRHLDTLRDLPATETILVSNLRFSREAARQMVEQLLPFLLDNDPGIDSIAISTTGLVP